MQHVWEVCEELRGCTSPPRQEGVEVGGREIECTEALPLVFQNRMGNAATVVLIQSSRFGALNTADLIRCPKVCFGLPQSLLHAFPPYTYIHCRIFPKTLYSQYFEFATLL